MPSVLVFLFFFFLHSSAFSDKKMYLGWPIGSLYLWIRIGWWGIAPSLWCTGSDVHGGGQSWFLTIPVGSGAGSSQPCGFAFQTHLFGTEVKV